MDGPLPTRWAPGWRLLSLLGLASVIETFGGVLLLLGLFTRPIGFLAAGEMAAANFLSHAPRGF